VPGAAEPGGVLPDSSRWGAYFHFPGFAHADPWFGLACVIVYIAGFAFSLGPVFWLMISEIFPLQHRSKAMAACTILNWAAKFVVSYFFLQEMSLIGLLAIDLPARPQRLISWPACRESASRPAHRPGQPASGAGAAPAAPPWLRGLRPPPGRAAPHPPSPPGSPRRAGPVRLAQARLAQACPELSP